jgi:hypothetical protein
MIQDKPDDLVIHGSFQDQNGVPIVGAAVHERFLGDPLSNCGTCFDLEKAPAFTDDSGQFRLALSDLDKWYSQKGPPGTWRQGCFYVLAVKDSRTMGFAINSGDELASSPLRLTALAAVDVRGIVVDEDGLPVVDANVLVARYLLFVGRGKYPNAPVGFWLYRSSFEDRVMDLTARTGTDGFFVIPNCPAMSGQLCLTITQPDFATLDTNYFPHQPKMRLAMMAGATVRIAVAVPDNTPAVGFAFNLSGIPDEAHCSTGRDGVTDESGHCEFRSLPSGNYTVRYLGGGPEPWAVPAIAVPRLAKGERRDLTLQAVAGSILCGHVCDAMTKAPLHHAEVRFESPSYPRTASTFQATYTDVEGKFTFPYPVEPGPLDVCVSIFHHGSQFAGWHKITVGTENRTELAFEIQMSPNDNS